MSKSEFAYLPEGERPDGDGWQITHMIASSKAEGRRRVWIRGLLKDDAGVPDGVWRNPVYEAADRARNQHLRDVDCNDQAGALVAAVDAAMSGVFVVTVIAERPPQVGYRSGIVIANSVEEAVGKWMRFAQADNPGWTISNPSALSINAAHIMAAKDRHG